MNFLERRCLVFLLPDVWLIFSFSIHDGEWLWNRVFKRVSRNEAIGDLAGAIEECLEASCPARQFLTGDYGPLGIARRALHKQVLTIGRAGDQEAVVVEDSVASLTRVAEQAGDSTKGIVRAVARGDWVATIQTLLDQVD